MIEHTIEQAICGLLMSGADARQVLRALTEISEDLSAAISEVSAGRLKDAKANKGREV